MPACLTHLLNPLPDNTPGAMYYPKELTTTDGADRGVDDSGPHAGLLTRVP